MVSLVDLESTLRRMSHSESALEAIQEFCALMPRTAARLELWNTENAIVQKPIDPLVAKASGFDTPDDHFLLLQGDIVRTNSAYSFGERVTGNPKYAVLNSSCDLVPGRARSSMLLRIGDIRRTDKHANEKLSQLTKFSRRDSMYVPPLGSDPEDVIGSAIHFDEICQIRNDDLFLANRIASLTLLGWRMFASFARVAIARSSNREVELRTALEARCKAA